MKTYYVYLLTNKSNRVLYVGITNNLGRRLLEHKHKTNLRSFTSRYNVNKLVFLEEYNDVRSAIEREKQIKAGSRKKKIDLINTINPGWIDLSEDFGLFD